MLEKLKKWINDFYQTALFVARKVLVEHLLKIVKELKNSEKKGNLKHLYRNELGKAVLAHDDAYSDSIDLANRRTTSDKVLKEFQRFLSK